MSVGDGRIVTEIARNSAQLFNVILIQALGIHEGINAIISDFAREVGVEYLSELDEVSLKTGDNPKGFGMASPFHSSQPVESLADLSDYDGEFPAGTIQRDTEQAAMACSFELPPEIRENWPVGLERPDWMENDALQPDIFDHHLRNGDLGAAWMTLNSSGWIFSEACEALQELGSQANDSTFDLLVTSWVGRASLDGSSY